MGGAVTVVNHPLVQHKLTQAREKSTSPGQFRQLLSEIGMLLTYEVTRDLPILSKTIETPITTMDAPFVREDQLVFLPILRAGMGLLDGMLRVAPSALVGHIGIYREPKTHVAVEYYFKVPPAMPTHDAIIVDPMLATGHSAVAAVDRIKETKPRSLKFLCILAAPEGIQYLHEAHPDVHIFTAAIDKGLNEKKYIIPGIGDAGDRLFGTS
jgi:uracil phosphoribosyltransferase